MADEPRIALTLRVTESDWRRLREVVGEMIVNGDHKASFQSLLINALNAELRRLGHSPLETQGNGRGGARRRKSAEPG